MAVQNTQTSGGVLLQLAQLPEADQKKIMKAFSQWAQQKGLNINQLQLNETMLEQAMTLFLQEVNGQQASTLGTRVAKYGAKLNYYRELKGSCPEGKELVYFKRGGKVCKQCLKKAEGGQVDDAIKAYKDKCGAKMKKKACGGLKMKAQKGGDVQPTDTINTSDGPKSLVNKKSTEKYQKFDPKKATLLEKDRASEKDYYAGRGDHDAHSAPVKKDYKDSKVKKHLLGGSLNGIPFIRMGLLKVE